MYLEVFPTGPIATNAVLLGCEKTKQATCIDPAQGSAPLFEKSISEKKFEIVSILLTHSHWDHIVDTAELKKKWQVPVLIHELDAANLENPGVDQLPLLFPVEGVQPDGFFKDGDLIKVGDLELRVIHTPGHSPGGVCFYLEKEKTLISGDTLFQGSIGNISFPMSEPTKMFESCKILAKLPPDTRVIPGHGPETRIGKETWLKNAKQYFSSP